VSTELKRSVAVQPRRKRKLKNDRSADAIVCSVLALTSAACRTTNSVTCAGPRAAGSNLIWPPPHPARKRLTTNQYETFEAALRPRSPVRKASNASFTAETSSRPGVRRLRCAGICPPCPGSKPGAGNAYPIMPTP